MNPEKQMLLFHLFPEMFSLRHEPEYDISHGIMVGNAWYAVIHRFCSLLKSNHVDEYFRIKGLKYAHPKPVDPNARQPFYLRRAIGPSLSIEWLSKRPLSPVESARLQGMLDFVQCLTESTCDHCGTHYGSSTEYCHLCMAHTPLPYRDGIEDIGSVTAYADQLPNGTSIFPESRGSKLFYSWDTPRHLAGSYIVQTLTHRNTNYQFNADWQFLGKNGWKFTYRLDREYQRNVNVHVATLSATFHPLSDHSILTDQEWVTYGLKEMELKHIMTPDEQIQHLLDEVDLIDGEMTPGWAR